MSKAIYMPKGKAGEYAKYACNFYIGCSNDCEYCYCKRGLLGHAMGAPKATLKKCFKDETDALLTFEMELMKNLEELIKHGLFFTFTSDPMLNNTRKLTIQAVDFAIRNDINCKILTKRADFIGSLPKWWFYKENRVNIAFGFTLTGHDELEPGASTNAERIEAMRKLHEMGFKTFASIEPVIDLWESEYMIKQTLGICDLYKIGLLSGKKSYTRFSINGFVDIVNNNIMNYSCQNHVDIKVYWKDSVLDYIGMKRETLPAEICVGADYNIFNK